ncbi:hypothetical protein ACF0H5_017586 [Mactra antiquata]
MAWRFKIIVLFITVFILGILFIEELITYSVKLPKHGYKKQQTHLKDVPLQFEDTQTVATYDINDFVHPSQLPHSKENVTKQIDLKILDNNERKPIPWKSLTDDEFQVETDFDNSVKNVGHSEMTTERSALDIENEHHKRINVLHEACRQEENKRRGEQRKGNLTHFYYNKEHKFAYCKVPKSGSTFWMKVFMILSRGKNYSNVISSMSRREIHDRSYSLNVNPMHILRRNVPTVIVSRNPFSRLFSAFIDKVYLPLFWDKFGSMPNANVHRPYIVNTSVEVMKNSNKPISGRLLRFKDSLRAKGMLYTKQVKNLIQPICLNDVSFEDFLKFIIAEVKLGHALEPHWAPISHLCHPCRFNIFKIVKQETFSTDVEHTLNEIGLELDKYDWLKSSLRENRVQNSAPGIISVVDLKLKQRSIRNCITAEEATFRLWKAFQIQGFISDSIDIPQHLTVNKLFKNDAVTKAVLDAVNTKPLTSTESRKQRQAYLTDAYRSISDETLTEIQKIYYLDFVLFGYSFTPPS